VAHPISDRVGDPRQGGVVMQRMEVSLLAPEAYETVAELDRRVSEAGIDGALYELIKIRASQINGCAYCIDLHIRVARKRGETDERIHALNAWRKSPFFSERERAALGLTVAVTLLSETRVPDDVWTEAEGTFGERELANLLMATVAKTLGTG
jgi:AhpD family alkylhydroperoxidase